MKAINSVFVVLVLSLVSVSCVEKSEKYQTLLKKCDLMTSRADSIQLAHDNLEAEFTEMMNLFTEIEKGFAEIRASEKQLQIDVAQLENGSKSAKSQLVNEVKQVKEIIESNRAKIKSLQGIIRKRNSENKVLNENISRLEQELSNKLGLITTLQEDLAKKNVQIQELNTMAADMKKVIAENDIEINKVSYLIASSKELKEMGIVENNGLFSKKLTGNELNSDKFVTVDKRNLQSIPLNAKKVKVMSAHPESSYTLDMTENGLVLNIKDINSFWSSSVTLVVRTIK